MLPSQETLIEEFGVSPPAVREAIHVLEADGLISVRRGNVGGAIVHLPSAERTAHMISMVLQSRGASPPTSAARSPNSSRYVPVCAPPARIECPKLFRTSRRKSTGRLRSSTM